MREEKCEKVLAKLREELLDADSIVNTGDFSEKSEKIKTSKLYDALNLMPKPALLGKFYRSSVKVEWLIKELCYHSFVYLNEKEMKFKVSKDPDFAMPGYIAVNTLRSFYFSQDFDAHLLKLMKLNEDTIKTQENHQIWNAF